MSIVAGSVVEYYVKGSNLEMAVVLSVASNGVRLLLQNGKETNITDKKVAHYTTKNTLSTSNRDLCRQALVELNAKREELAKELDLPDIHSLLAEEQPSYSLGEMASYLFEAEDEDSAAALLRCLLEDKIYFKHKNGMFMPSSQEELEQAMEQQEKRRQAELEEQELMEALHQMSCQGKISEVLESNISWLKAFVVEGVGSNIPKRLSNALEKTGLSSVQKVFNLLVRSGVFHEDENFDLIRNKLHQEFADEQLEQVDKLCEAGLNFEGRVDLTHLKAWAIDTPLTKDRDDAFSFYEEEGGVTLWIHVADPTALILPEDVLDLEAKVRGVSIYMPDKRIYMLPEKLSAELLSLDEGQDRLALSFKMTFDGSQNLTDFEVFESKVRIELATTYPLANEAVNQDEWLKAALQFSQKLKEKRKEMGAIISPKQPELDIQVVDGEIIIEHEDRETLTGGMISEFMVWVNHGAALWFSQRNLACLYRVQESKGGQMDFGEEFDPVLFWQAIKTFTKTKVGLELGRHTSLGFDGYTQVTSPLRRYSDLVLHRQLKSFLKDGSGLFDGQGLTEAVFMSDIGASLGDEIMRNREQYFLLKYIKLQRQELAKQQKQLEFDGVVVDNSGPTDVVFYVDFINGFKHCKRPNFDLKVGQPVKVRINQIDLYDRLIRFELYPHE
jgi:exoribonuclease-2